MSRIVVFGATGYAGSRIVAEAAGRGHEVTGVSRTSGAAAPAAGVAVITGSLYDADLVRELAQHADVLISAIPSRSRDDDKSLPEALPLLVEVAQKFGVRIGIVGGAGSLLVSEGGEEVRVKFAAALPQEAMPEINTHAAFLGALRETPSDVDWFFLSPGLSFGAHVPGERLGRYRVGGDVMLVDEQGTSAIGGDDYAIALIDEIEVPAHHRQRFTVAY
ncbi:MAG: NAD(P)H-binding protein [Candidatus Nanopelagicales bacterium]